MTGLAIPADLRAAYDRLAADLGAVFGPRLYALVAFGPRLRSALAAAASRELAPGDALALVDTVTMSDLAACVTHAERWRREGLRMPLLLGRREFLRSLDAFPLEYDDIVAHHVSVTGDDPFEGVTVAAEDLRRACEARTKSHLLHLREGYLEARGRPGAVASLILASASPLSALLGNLARLRGLRGDTVAGLVAGIADVAGIAPGVVERVLALEASPTLSGDEAARLYPEYLAAVECLVAYVDGWTTAAGHRTTAPEA